MTHTVSNAAPVSGSHTVKQYAGFGIRGADIPTTGDSGESPVLNDGILSTSEYYWEVETPPGSGAVTIFPDMTFEHAGAADGSWTWVYRLYWVDADGTNGNATATVTDVFGTAAIVLAIADATHGHASDNLGLSTTGSASLSVADGAHAHSADSLTLATQRLLAIADALHAHTADNEVLDTSSAAWLTLQEGNHAHAADSLGLSLQTWLAIADAVSQHAADNLTLDTSNSTFLTVQDAAHAHSTDGIGLSLNTWLAIVDAAHAHTADAPTLSASLALQIAEALHAHYADIAVLSFPGAMTLTPDDIIAIVTAMNANGKLLTIPTFLALKD